MNTVGAKKIDTQNFARNLSFIIRKSSFYMELAFKADVIPSTGQRSYHVETTCVLNVQIHILVKFLVVESL